jgi:neopullulanase
MVRTFIHNWSTAILKQYPNFHMVGEVFERDAVQTAFFQGGTAGWDGVDTKLPSVFDFKLWETSQEVFTGKKPVRALRDVLKYDGLYPNINRVTTLTNNHDTERFMSLPGATLEGSMLHTAFMLSTRGIPQLYYGEEIAMTGGHDPNNRDDFPGGWPTDTSSKFTKAGRTLAEERIYNFVRGWTKLRHDLRSLREGRTVDLAYDSDVYVFGRIFEEDRRERHRKNNYAVVGFNFSDTAKSVTIPSQKLGELESITTVVADSYERRSFPSAGWGKIGKSERGDPVLTIPPRSVVIYAIDLAVITEN